jgi:hypothetical protein
LHNHFFQLPYINYLYVKILPNAAEIRLGVMNISARVQISSTPTQTRILEKYELENMDPDSFFPLDDTKEKSRLADTTPCAASINIHGKSSRHWMPKSAAENRSPCHPNIRTKEVIVKSRRKPLKATTAGINTAPNTQKPQSKIMIGKRKTFASTLQNDTSDETV